MPAAIARRGEGAARRGPRRGSVRSARMAAGAVFSMTLLLAALAGEPPAGGPAAVHAAVPLDAPLTASWQRVPLRDWATRVADAAAVPVVIDRRLDPDTPITLEIHAEPLRGVLGKAASAAQGDVAVLASHVRLVPAGAAGPLLVADRARRATIAKLPARQRPLLDTPRDWGWADGARPADLIVTAARSSGLTIEGLGRVPHDHLPAATLRGLAAAEAVDLVLAHYDLRVVWQAGSAARPPTGRIVDIGADMPPGFAAGTERPREATVGRRPGDIDAARGRDARPGKEPRESFTLRAAAPLDELLDTVAKRLGLELAIDRESLARSGIATGEIVRLSVADASRGELLDAILEPLGLRWRITAGRLDVSAPPD